MYYLYNLSDQLFFLLGIIFLILYYIAKNYNNRQSVIERAKDSKEFDELKKLKSLDIIDESEFQKLFNKLIENNENPFFRNILNYKYLIFGFAIITVLRPILDYIMQLNLFSFAYNIWYYYDLKSIIFLIGIFVALMQFKGFRENKFVKSIKENYKYILLALLILVLMFVIYNSFIKVSPKKKGIQFAKEFCEIENKFYTKINNLLEKYIQDYDNNKFSNNRLAREILENTLRYPNEVRDKSIVKHMKKIEEFKKEYINDNSFIYNFEEAYTSYSCQDSLESINSDLSNQINARIGYEHVNNVKEYNYDESEESYEGDYSYDDELPIEEAVVTMTDPVEE